MSSTRTDMHRLQEVIRLHRLGESSRRIARLLSIGRDTVRKYVEIFGQSGQLEGPVDALPATEALSAAVQASLGVPALPAQISSVSSWAEEIARLRAKGAGPTAIHDHLRLHQPDFVGSLSSIQRLCLRLERAAGPLATDVAIPVETAPGEIAQVDFGYAGKRYDADRGILRKSWVFVMRLGFSRRMYCELVFDQTVQTWIDLHIRAFAYFGGVPRVIVPNNLKAAVVRAAFGVDDDPLIQRTYRELARHYGFQVDPAPPREPKKKGKVEAGVRFVKGNFLTTWESVDLRRDNVALLHWLDRRRHGTTGRPPLELFEEHERGALLELPKARFERVTWKRARLHTDSHVQIEGAFYSAPWKYLHQELWVRASEGGIAIYAQDVHLWTHARAARGQRRTVEEHLPEHRRDLRHRSREHWVERAGRMGPEVERLVETIFAADDVLTQLRRVQAIVTHLERFPLARAQATARRALHFGCSDYRGIKNILRLALDSEPLLDERKRAWSTGSRFARKPTEPLFAHMELTDVHH
jgi:transposase